MTERKPPREPQPQRDPHQTMDEYLKRVKRGIERGMDIVTDPQGRIA